jgi:putative spermidine/putrescine transport system permease protein
MANVTQEVSTALPGQRRGLVLSRRWSFAWVGVVPFFLYVAVFLLVPSLWLAIGAFQTGNGGWTLDHVRRLFESQFAQAYVTSIKLSATTALTGGLFGFFVAYAAISDRSPGWIRNTLSTFSGVAANFAGVPLALAFIAALGQTGVLTVFLNDHGLHPYDQGFTLYHFTGLAIVYTYFQLPLMVLIITPSLEGLRREWREAATNMGASPLQYWRWVGLPILMPSLLGAMVLLFGSAFAAYATAYALVGGSFNLVPILIGVSLSGNLSFDPQLAYALALGMIVIIGITVIIYTLLMRRASRWQATTQQVATTRAPLSAWLWNILYPGPVFARLWNIPRPLLARLRNSLRPALVVLTRLWNIPRPALVRLWNIFRPLLVALGRLWNVFWLVLAALFFLLPLYATAQFSLQTGPGKYGFDAYRTILNDPAFKDSFLLSFKLAIATVVISTILMVPTVYLVNLKLPKVRPVMDFIAVLPFVVPPIVLAVGILKLFNRPSLTWLISGPHILALTYVILALPFTYRALDAGMRAINLRTLTEAAQSVGASWITILVRIILPNLRYAMLAGAFLTVTLVMGEFTVSSLMLFHTFAVYVEYKGETQAEPAAALAVISFALTWAAMFGILFLGRGVGRRQAQIGGTR